MSHLVLFDIDLTLMRMPGVGRSAMGTVLLEMFNIEVEDALASIDFAGRTDRWILRRALAAHRFELDDFEEFLMDFDARYAPLLETHFSELGGEVLPGVVSLLDELAAIPNVRLGIATGNLRNAAWFKLKAFDLDRYFIDGGFADDAEQRSELVTAAIKRLGGRADGHHIIVVGDSMHDITAAKANGALAVGVTTGRSSSEELAEAGADLVLPDLSDPAPVLALLVPPEL